MFRRLTAGPKSIRDEINETTHRKKPGFFRREISEAQTVLQATGKEERFPVLCAASLLLFAVGAGIAIIINNLLLVPVLAAGMMFLPFWYIKLTAGHYRKAVTAELETALSIITTAYLRSEDLQTAVEENINYLNPPVQGVFRSFLTRIKHIDPDVNAALAELKSAIDNEVWREWCEALSACQYDHSMKSTLNPIVAKLSDMRIINGELENLVFAPRKEFISMAALVVLNIPLLYFLNKDWYATLMTTVPGKAVLAVCAAAIFISFARVVKCTSQSSIGGDGHDDLTVPFRRGRCRGLVLHSGGHSEAAPPLHGEGTSVRRASREKADEVAGCHLPWLGHQALQVYPNG